MTMTRLAFWLFAAVASGGLLMTLAIALKVSFPRGIGAIHGLAGLGAMCVLFAANLRGEAATPEAAWWALGVFTGGFVGGVSLFRVIFRDRATLPLIALHASAGSAGLYLLYLAAFSAR